MPRIAATASIDELVRNAIAPVIARASEYIARAMARMVTERLQAELEGSRRAKIAPRQGRSSPRARAEITRWIADRRARRLPTFVIEATGLKTKKQVVAKYGSNAVFERGKPLPKMTAATASRDQAKATPTAKAPVVRKKAAAA